MTWIKAIIIFLALYVILYFYDPSGLSAIENKIKISTSQLLYVDQNEKLCKESVNDILEIARKKTNSKLTIIESKNFNNIQDSINYASIWEHTYIEISDSTEPAIQDLNSLPKNSFLNITILVVRIDTSYVDVPGSEIVINYPFVCLDGKVMESSKNKFK